MEIVENQTIPKPTFKQNIFIKSYLGVDSFGVQIDIAEMSDLIAVMKKDPTFVSDYLIQKGAKLVNADKLKKAIEKSKNIVDSETLDSETPLEEKEMNPTQTEKFYTIKEIGEKLSVHHSAVLRWIQQGKLKGKKKDSKWIIKEKDFITFQSKRNNKEVVENKEYHNESLSETTKKMGISEDVLVHLIGNKEFYSPDFSINQVFNKMEEKHSYRQINSALINLSNKGKYVEKVLGKRGIYKLSEDSQKKAEIEEAKNYDTNLSVPNDVIKDFAKHRKDNFSINNICRIYPKAKMRSVAKCLQKGHELVEKVSHGIYRFKIISHTETVDSKPNHVEKLEIKVAKVPNSAEEIKAAVNILRFYPSDSSVQSVLSDLAGRLASLI